MAVYNTDVGLLTNEDFLNQAFLANLNKPLLNVLIVLDIIVASVLLMLSLPVLMQLPPLP